MSEKQRSQRASDIAEITEVLHRYCRGVDRADFALLAGAFFDDAIDELHDPVNAGGRAIATSIRDGNLTTIASMHSISNVLVEFDDSGDGAACESYLIFWDVKDSDGRRIMRNGRARYVDRFERRQGEWRIAHRAIVGEYLRSDPLDGELPGNGAARDASDESYQIFRDPEPFETSEDLVRADLETDRG